jgi:23S rRNA pseudouridine2605 synthase
MPDLTKSDELNKPQIRLNKAIEGQPLPKIEHAYLLLHKPTGYVTSRRCGHTQKTVYELLPKEYQPVDPAGRLDQDSSGALILSSDGDFLFKITHPRFHLPKLYEITLSQPLTPSDIQKLQTGIQLLPENKLAKMKSIVPDKKNPLRYQVELITGYNRQIRRSLADIGYQVKTLHRISFGSIALGELPVGKVRQLTHFEKQSLLSSASQPK